MKRLFVTGASGFVGRHIETAAAANTFASYEFVPAPLELDLRELDATRDMIRSVRPDAVMHLAARTFVPDSFVDPRGTFEVNLFGTLNVLQALKSIGFNGRMIYVSSGDVYGRVPERDLPIDETRLPEPLSPYAVSKIAAEQLVLQQHRADGLDVMIARPFNHVGPGQDARFVLPSFARQIMAIASGAAPPVIEVGDIDTTRDFTDVRDVVAAYASMFRSGRAGRTYIIGSGREWRVRDLLERMCSLAGVTAELRQNADRLRATEQRRMAANARLLTADTGWTPQIPMDTSLTDILDAARSNS